MPTKAEILQFLKREVDDITLGETPEGEIKDNAIILDELGMDSLDYATMTISAENKFNVKVTEDDIDWAEVDTLNKLADLFASKLAG
jgi:acyl carrier protein